MTHPAQTAVTDWLSAKTPAGQVAIDPALGNLRGLTFHVDGRDLRPLHTAHWVDDPGVQADEAIAPIERKLAGDFFCAPFGHSELSDAPIHGWSANSRWSLAERADGLLRLRLDREIFGASFEKELRLSNTAPILYQTHRIMGGEGALTVAHHVMTHMAAGGRLDFSPKQVAIAPDKPFEPGRNRLACPAASAELAAFPAAGGGVVDLHAYPAETGHEDFVTLVERPGAAFGWTAVLRAAEDDLLFVLKDPHTLPVTMLWLSNGGRDRAPWGGRHTGVLGIEDGCTAGAAGHRAALGETPIGNAGAATVLRLRPDAEHVVRQVIGAVPRPRGWQRIAAIALRDDRLVITEGGGETLALNFAPGFFNREF